MTQGHWLCHHRVPTAWHSVGMWLVLNNDFWATEWVNEDGCLGSSEEGCLMTDWKTWRKGSYLERQKGWVKAGKDGNRQQLGFAGQGGSIWLRMRVLGELKHIKLPITEHLRLRKTAPSYGSTKHLKCHYRQGQDHVGPYELQKETEFFSWGQGEATRFYLLLTPLK